MPDQLAGLRTVQAIAEQVEGPRLMAQSLQQHTAQVPLSYAQEQMWVLYELDRTSPAYSCPAVQWLRGTMHAELLEATVQQLGAAQHSLRSLYGYTIDGGTAVQQVVPMEQWVVPMEGCSSCIAGVAADALAVELGTVMELEHGVLRVMLAQLEHAQLHLLVLHTHHIATDGVSHQVQWEQLGGMYNALVLGEPRCSRLRMQYTDYAVWQRRWYGGGRLEDQLEWWKGALGDVPVLELQPDHARPAVLGSAGGMVEVELGCAEALQGLCSGCGATEMHGVLALWATLLCKHTGQPEVVVGTPYSNRARKELQGVIGYFVNTLGVLVQVCGGFGSVVRGASRAMLGALEHGETPFVEVVQAVVSSRDGSRTPVYQTLLTFQDFNAVGDESQAGAASALQPAAPGHLNAAFNGSVNEQGAVEDTSKFEVELHLSPGPQRLEGTIVYSTELYQASTAQRLGNALQVLTARLLVQPNLQPMTMSGMGQYEAELSLKRWNSTAAPLSTGSTVDGLFEVNTLGHCSGVAVVFEGETVSYGQLGARTGGLTAALCAHSLAADGVVGLCLEKSMEEVIGMVGIMRAGSAYVPLDPKQPGARLGYLVKQCGCAAVVAQRRFVGFADGLGCALALMAVEDALLGGSEGVAVSSSPQRLAYVLFTSGSTGRPKGVMVQHGAFSMVVHYHIHKFEFTGSTYCLLPISFTFDPCVLWSWTCLSSSATLVVTKRGAMLDAVYLNQMLASNQISCTTLVPAVLKILVASIGRLPSCLEALIVGGEAFEPSLVNSIHSLRPEANVVNTYGPTEGAVTATDHKVCSALNLWKTPIGRPLFSTECTILDANGQFCPVGIPGEMQLAGPKLAQGYIGRSDLSMGSFRYHHNQRHYTTGDRVRWLGTGNLEFLGRVDFQIKLNGQRIEAGEIEAVAQKSPGVNEALVLIRKSLAGADQLVAYVLPEAAKPESVLETCRSGLAGYMVPSAVVALAGWPLNSSGKLDRRALPEPVDALQVPIGNSQSLSAQGHSAHAPGEAAVAEVCAQMLGLQVGQLDRDMSLVQLGLTSLQAAKLHRELTKHELTGIKSVATVLQHPTIAGLAGLVVDRSMAVVEPGSELGGQSKAMELEQAVARLAGQALGAQVGAGTELQMSAGQLKQLSLLLSRELDVWLMPDHLAELRTAHAIAEHVEGPQLMARTQHKWDASMPLSYAQEQMWVLYELDRESTAYSSPRVQWLRGVVQAELLRAAVEQLGAAQHSLRTWYGYTGDGRHEAVQCVVPIEQWSVSVTLCSRPSAMAAELAVVSELGTPMELEHGVLRVVLEQLHHCSLHLVILHTHHIATDGVSQLVQWDQLKEAYSALMQGEQPLLRRVHIQYADYAVWQQRWFGGGRLEEQLDWWKVALGDVPVLELQPDHARPALLGTAGGTVELELECADALRVLCRSCGATEMHGVLALWATLLCKHTGQPEVVVGVPYANRAREELQGVIGYFVISVGP